MMLIPPNKNAIDISIILSNVAVNVILVKKVEKHEVNIIYNKIFFFTLSYNL